MPEARLRRDPSQRRVARLASLALAQRAAGEMWRNSSRGAAEYGAKNSAVIPAFEAARAQFCRVEDAPQRRAGPSNLLRNYKSGSRKWARPAAPAPARRAGMTREREARLAASAGARSRCNTTRVQSGSIAPYIPRFYCGLRGLASPKTRISKFRLQMLLQGR